MKIKQKGAQNKLILYIVLSIIGFLILYMGLTIAINDGHPIWTIALIVITAIAMLGSLFVKIKNLTIVLDDEAIRIGITSVKYKDVEKVIDEDRFVIVRCYNVEVKLRFEDRDKDDFITYLNKKVAEAKEEKELQKSD